MIDFTSIDAAKSLPVTRIQIFILFLNVLRLQSLINQLNSR